MANINYQDLKNELLDRIQHMIDVGQLTERQRTMLEAPHRLAQAVSEAQLEFCKNAESNTVPDLVEEVSPNKKREYNSVASYEWPTDVFSEREDGGILAPILDGEELDWNQAIDRKSVEHRANRQMFKGYRNCFGVDDFKKRFYVPTDISFSLVVFKNPTRVTASDIDSTDDSDIPEKYFDTIAKLSFSVLLSMVFGSQQAGTDLTNQVAQRSDEDESENSD